MVVLEGPGIYHVIAGTHAAERCLWRGSFSFQDMLQVDG